MNIFVVIIIAWASIIAIVVAADIGSGWFHDERAAWMHNHPKVAKPEGGRHRARK